MSIFLHAIYIMCNLKNRMSYYIMQKRSYCFFLSFFFCQCECVFVFDFAILMARLNRAQIMRAQWQTVRLMYDCLLCVLLTCCICISYTRFGMSFDLKIIIKSAKETKPTTKTTTTTKAKFDTRVRKWFNRYRKV